MRFSDSYFIFIKSVHLYETAAHLVFNAHFFINFYFLLLFKDVMLFVLTLFRHKTVFDALHALLINSLVIALVFTAIAASRNDNTATKKLNEKPTVKLFVFGVLFVLYLSFKAYEISIPYIWFCYKKTLDVVSLLLGLSAMVLLLLVSTDQFTY